ncbi:protein rep [Sporosarcina sp. FSL K6-5500]|uniref:protein rep n=1 Tax=Sporosarcina sp. FSL K6-5500 TaxID=2921558 RepID=UPI0030FB5679
MGQDYEILTDFNSFDKERPWRSHKTNSQLLSESYERISERYKGTFWANRSENVNYCGSSLKFSSCPHGHEKNLKWANFCRIRMCPMCSWRKSLLNAYNLKRVAHEAVQQKKMRFLFLTLTVENCTGEDLAETISHLMKSWDRFAKRKQFQKLILGWFRSLEVTRNFDDGKFHPHFHVLLAVSPSYFSHGYIKTEEWVKLWQKSLQVDYMPIVDIRTVKNKRNKEKEQNILEEKGIEESHLSGGAIAELAKYTTKADDFLVYNRRKSIQKGKEVLYIPDVASGIDKEKTDEVVFVLDTSLARRRLIAYGGELKKALNSLEEQGKIQDSEDDDADLVHVDNEDKNCKCSVCQSDMLEELYSWIPGVKNYLKKE